MNWNLGSNVWMIIPIGLLFFVLYYVVFRFLIERYDIKTPGREDEMQITEEVGEEELNATLSTTNYAYLAKKLLQCSGGAENVESACHCITRLRLEVLDGQKVDIEKIKQTGVLGVVCPSSDNVQIIIGREVQKVYEEFEKLL